MPFAAGAAPGVVLAVEPEAAVPAAVGLEVVALRSGAEAAAALELGLAAAVVGVPE